MKRRNRALAMAAVGVMALTQAQGADPGPDPKAIPVPEIRNTLRPMPGVEELPDHPEMPDVLTFRDGRKVKTAEDWKARRAEIKEILEYYALGQAPPAPGNVKGREISSELVNNGKVRYRLVRLTFGPAESLSLDIGVFTPTTGGPFASVLMPQFGSPPGAVALPRLPPEPSPGNGDILSFIGPASRPATRPGATRPAASTQARGPNPFAPQSPEQIAASNAALANGYAYITFNYNDCGEDTRLRLADGSWAFRTTRFFPAYPGYDWSLIRAWGWGCSRVLDYLETQPEFDRSKFIVSGISRLGKSALYIGAIEERFAMIAPVASSGGGTPAYRFSGPNRGGNEGLAEMMRKYPNQFGPKLRQFYGHVDKLPFDQHFFVALCAPRPVIALEGLKDQNVNPLGVRQTMTGGQPAYDLLKVSDRVGVYWTDRPHGMQAGDWTGLLAFADKHLFNKPTTLDFTHYPDAAYPTTQPK